MPIVGPGGLSEGTYRSPARRMAPRLTSRSGAGGDVTRRLIGCGAAEELVGGGGGGGEAGPAAAGPGLRGAGGAPSGGGRRLQPGPEGTEGPGTATAAGIRPVVAACAGPCVENVRKKRGKSLVEPCPAAGGQP